MSIVELWPIKVEQQLLVGLLVVVAQHVLHSVAQLLLLGGWLPGWRATTRDSGLLPKYELCQPTLFEPFLDAIIEINAFHAHAFGIVALAAHSRHSLNCGGFRTEGLHNDEHDLGGASDIA